MHRRCIRQDASYESSELETLEVLGSRKIRSGPRCARGPGVPRAIRIIPDTVSPMRASSLIHLQCALHNLRPYDTDVALLSTRNDSRTLVVS